MLFKEKYSVVASFVLFFLIGSPIWYYTTLVYRAPLPIERIQETKSKKAYSNLNFKQSFRLLVPKELFHSSKKQELIQTFKEFDTSSRHSAFQNIQFEFSVFQDNAKRLYPTNIGEYNIHLKCELDSNLDTSAYFKITSSRDFFLKMKSCKPSEIAKVIEAFLIDIYSSTGNGHQTEKVTTTVKYASEYPIMFSLLQENPAERLVNWHIHQAIQEFVRPFADAFSMVSNLTLHSQTLGFTELPVQPTLMKKENGTEFHQLNENDLSLFLNSENWNLAFTGSMNPPLRFLIYVPSLKHSPLKIVKNDNTLLNTNAFLIPQWGGVVIHNPPSVSLEQENHQKTNDSTTIAGAPKNVVIENETLKEIISLFMNQLRQLLGVNHLQFTHLNSLPGKVNIDVQSSTTAISAFEMDQVIQKRLLGNLKETQATLNSLATLIQKLENMVVLDHISLKIKQALDHYDTSVLAIENERNLEKAWEHAKEAFLLSERVFFDPSIVSMLYFPDEHKFAVYMPLFVPLFVPVIMTVLKDLLGLRKKSKLDRKQKED